MKIKTHINKATGDAYYSTVDEDGEIVYSLTKDFSDLWTEAGMEAFQSESIKFQTEADRAWSSGEHE